MVQRPHRYKQTTPRNFNSLFHSQILALLHIYFLISMVALKYVHKFFNTSPFKRHSRIPIPFAYGLDFLTHLQPSGQKWYNPALDHQRPYSFLLVSASGLSLCRKPLTMWYRYFYSLWKNFFWKGRKPSCLYPEENWVLGLGSCESHGLWILSCPQFFNRLSIYQHLAGNIIRNPPTEPSRRPTPSFIALRKHVR